jgi:hypothetical protein
VLPSIEDRIARYNAWRKREPIDRPMIGIFWEPDIPPLPEFMEQIGIGKTVSPDHIEPEICLPTVAFWHQWGSALPRDMIQAITPGFGMPWVEAIAGCPVVTYPGSLWAGSCLGSYADRAPICFDPDNPWLRKLIKFTQVLVQFADGRFPVALPQMRGPLDTLAAMRTPERMCLDFIEHPDEVHRILDELTDLWIGIAEAVLDVIPPFCGGYCSRMKMWAPGKAVTPQNDSSSLISAEMYKEFVLPWDQKIVSHFPYHSFHVHSTEHHQIDNLLTLKNLTAIQFTLEHTYGGPPLDVTLPVVRRILDKKPLLLVIRDLDTVKLCIRELPAQGLFVMLRLGDLGLPEDHEAWLRGR